MPTIQLEESRRRAHLAASTHVEPEEPDLHPGGDDEPDIPDPRSPRSPRFSAEQQWVIEIRGEIDDYAVLLKRLRSVAPAEVFLELSGITARLAEIRLTCVRSESRRLAALRTREIDPILEEVDRQFRFHSRIAAIRQMEYEMSGRTT